MIPKVIHYFWDRDREPPPCVARWPSVLTKGWKLKLWTPEDVEHKDKEWLIANKAYATLGDVARLQAMYWEGGIYLDTDISLLRSPDHLLEKSWVCVESPSTICNAALGARPGNQFFREALKRIRECGLEGVVRCGHCNIAGPVLLTNLWTGTYGELPQGVEETGMKTHWIDILPQHTWYPYSWDKPPCEPFPDTVGVHLWSGSWKSK